MKAKWIIGLVALLILPLAWWLGSPLFVNNEVAEADPFAVSDVAEVQESAPIVQEVEATAVPTEPPATTTVDEAEPTVETVAPTATVPEPTAVVEETDDEMTADSNEVVTLVTAMFEDADPSHRGSGTATILQQGDRRVLRLTDFEVTNGPDLHVYLVDNVNGRVEQDFGGFVDLGSLKGNVGDQNYEISADVDLSQFTGVVIYCQPFHVTFSFAQFMP